MISVKGCLCIHPCDLKDSHEAFIQQKLNVPDKCRPAVCYECILHDL